MTKITPFDAADYLDDEETIAAYLSAALAENDPDAFLQAIRTVARARGMAQLARDSGEYGAVLGGGAEKIATGIHGKRQGIPLGMWDWASDRARLRIRCRRG